MRRLFMMRVRSPKTIACCRAGLIAMLMCSTPGVAAESAGAPDFSGIWAHLVWPDVGPPVSGPGPVTNRSRGDAAPVVASINGTVTTGVSNPYALVGDYTNPILKADAASVVKRHGDI